jgi:23S rRNA pseudouridine955/2504/2580 synthase
MSAPGNAGVRQFTVAPDDDGIRLDRWFKRHMPEANFGQVSRWARTGQLRLDGKRAAPGDRIEAGQIIRVPPQGDEPATTAKPQRQREVLTEDEIEAGYVLTCQALPTSRHVVVDYEN